LSVEGADVKLIKKMKNTISKIMLAVACVVFMSSCGGGSGKTIASNEFLGDLPNVVFQKQYEDSVRLAETEEEVSKAKLKGKYDDAKEMQLLEQYKVAQKEAETKYEAEIAKIAEKLIGKEVPVEVVDSLGFKVTSSKITEVKDRGVQLEIAVEITDIKEANARWGSLYLTAQNLDKEGNPIGRDGSYSAKLSDKTDGATGTVSYFISVYAREAEAIANFAKIRFIKK
jgi:hypothetical protein